MWGWPSPWWSTSKSVCCFSSPVNWRCPAEWGQRPQSSVQLWYCTLMHKVGSGSGAWLGHIIDWFLPQRSFKCSRVNRSEAPRMVYRTDLTIMITMWASILMNGNVLLPNLNVFKISLDPFQTIYQALSYLSVLRCFSWSVLMCAVIQMFVLL